MAVTVLMSRIGFKSAISAPIMGDLLGLHRQNLTQPQILGPECADLAPKVVADIKWPASGWVEAGQRAVSQAKDRTLHSKGEEEV
jgi:hypothetical protein